MSWQSADLLKRQIPLLDYLQGQGWKPARRSAGGRLMGLCPLHTDHRPSFLVDPGKNLFYCYGCGRGGDVIRLAELYHLVYAQLKRLRDSGRATNHLVTPETLG
jgi:DNA primase